jgi:3-deoxy-D-manno-octulosonic-acid transferase
LPQASWIISTGTETGQAVARRHFADSGALVCYFPLDLPWAVQRYLDHLRPQLFIVLESEIWPNFLSAAHGCGVRLALTNARLSDRSFTRILKYRRYFADIIELFDSVAAGSPLDYERWQRLGLSPGKLHLTGNLKIDRLLQAQAERDDGRTLESWTRVLALSGQPVWLAASTHPGEEEAVLAAFRTLRAPYPALLLLLAPRHPERANDLSRLLQQQGLGYHLWSRLRAGQELRRHPVVLIDTIGDLFRLYGLADLAFVGGSLVPHGGQNILEPAAWGLAPLYGPHLQNFRWAQAILEEARAGIPVQDTASLAAAAQDLLAHPQERAARGTRARAALLPHQGAARRQAELLVKLAVSREQ